VVVVDGSLIEQVLGLLQGQGFFTHLLPFLLVFAIFYALLLELAIFGKTAGKEPGEARGIRIRGKKVSAIIAAVSAFYAINFPPFAAFLQQSTAFASVALVLIFFTLVIVGFLSSKLGDPGQAPFEGVGRFLRMYAGWVAAFILILATVIFVSTGGYQTAASFGVTGEAVTTIILAAGALLGVGLFIRWLIRPGWQEEAERLALQIEEAEAKMRRATRRNDQESFERWKRHAEWLQRRKNEIEQARRVIR